VGRSSAPRRNRVEIVDFKRNMRLLGRAKINLDAEVELHVAEFKPNATSRG
jgi:hypothetical protein